VFCLCCNFDFFSIAFLFAHNRNNRMTSPISPISAQALNLLPIPQLPVASLSNRGWIVRLRSDMRLYESNGMAWVDFVSGGAPPSGSISSTTTIIGNPSDMDSVSEMTAIIAELRRWKQVVDADADDEVDTIEEVNISLTVTSIGQTAFTLPRAPRKALSPILIAGMLSFSPSPQTFTINGTTLNWHYPVQLAPSDSLFLSYR
jgi:hypothetical protein